MIRLFKLTGKISISSDMSLVMIHRVMVAKEGKENTINVTSDGLVSLGGGAVVDGDWEDSLGDVDSEVLAHDGERHEVDPANATDPIEDRGTERKREFSEIGERKGKHEREEKKIHLMHVHVSFSLNA